MSAPEVSTTTFTPAVSEAPAALLDQAQSESSTSKASDNKVPGSEAANSQDQVSIAAEEGKDAQETDLKPCDLDALRTFEFERVLSESSATGSAYFLGTIHNEPAIIHIQRTAIGAGAGPRLVKEGLESLEVFLENRPYFSAHALIARTSDSPPDLALKLIWPCTPVHIKKYSHQPRRLVTETPAMYASVVEPYISSFPPDRLEWVYAILEGRKEADRVLFRDTHPEQGFVITPDLKWDGTTVSALYLTAIVQTREIRSIRDLEKRHLPLLRRIHAQAYATAGERYGVEEGQLRVFVHYQPSYYHFHVHIVHVQHEIMAGMAVGQAHMLADVINWLDLSPTSGPSLPAQMTFTYPLGVEHGLYAGIAAAQAAGGTAEEDPVEGREDNALEANGANNHEGNSDDRGDKHEGGNADPGPHPEEPAAKRQKTSPEPEAA